ncbi:MAG: CvpA family protein [Gemmataceae bacterium]|nr:CvpA family protein [Gemmataceae bacterium]
MLIAITIFIMVAVAYAHLRGGLFTALCMFVNQMVAGLIAFGFFEPIAEQLERSTRDTFLAGYEDFFALIGLFAVSLGLLRLVTNLLAPEMLDFSGNVQYLGALIGGFSGYLLAGFLICALETLPWHENFLEFRPMTGPDQGLRSVLPPDRVWLATMRYAGAHCLAWEEGRIDEDFPDSPYYRYLTFDRYGTFEQRYLRYRRFNEQRGPRLYQRELEKELYRDY